MLRVFISSASGALMPYRQAAVEVCHRLGYQPVFMEDFDPQRPPAEDVCRTKVEGCDVLVLLLAHRYGSRPPGRDLSYTELEYRWAVDRADMRLLPFVVDPAFPWPPPDIDHNPDAGALARLIVEVEGRHLVKRLAEVGAFREDLMIALSQDQAGLPRESRSLEQSPTPRPPRFHAVPSYVGSAPFTGRSTHMAELDRWGQSGAPVMVVEAIGGTGKSALTWHWSQERAPSAVDSLAGRMWWSFYDGSASMTRFLQELLAYTTGSPMSQIRQLERTALTEQVMAELCARPYLIVLDGFERLLTAYHQFDPSKLRDEDVEPDKRLLIEPHAEDVMRQLTTVQPSRILISTRLMPLALRSRFGALLPGVRHLRLPGLSDSDTRTLLARLGVRGSEVAMAKFFGQLGNHPLLVGIVAGLVGDYRAEPGGFDRWLADPTAGAALSVPDLDLTQRRTHILAAALDGLAPGPQRLLSWISVLPGVVRWDVLADINPFRSGLRGAAESALLAQAQLDAALKDLENRGLLWWDRSSNTYDLHPIIRAFAYEQLEENDRVRANDRIRDHFQALPSEDPQQATSVEDLARSITIFRALVGANHYDDASQVWQRIDKALIVDIGAYNTATELLQPLADAGLITIQSDLAIAYMFTGRYEEAINHRINILSHLLENADPAARIDAQLSGLEACYWRSGSLIANDRCMELREALTHTIGVESTGGIMLNRAAQAISRGLVERGQKLLDRAEGLGPSGNSPWFYEGIRYWWLQLALISSKSLTARQLSKTGTARSWQFRYATAELRCKGYMLNKQFAQAYFVSEEHDQLGRNAGLDIAPARSALLLARLGHTTEAQAATEDALNRLPRLHPADRPHYYLAQVLRELGRHTEALTHARLAYRLAWSDGPPFSRHQDLRDARELLQAMGEPVPELPIVDPASVRIPLEDEVRAYIARLEAQR